MENGIKQDAPLEAPVVSYIDPSRIDPKFAKRRKAREARKLEKLALTDENVRKALAEGKELPGLCQIFDQQIPRMLEYVKDLRARDAAVAAKPAEAEKAPPQQTWAEIGPETVRAMVHDGLSDVQIGEKLGKSSDGVKQYRQKNRILRRSGPTKDGRPNPATPTASVEETPVKPPVMKPALSDWIIQMRGTGLDCGRVASRLEGLAAYVRSCDQARVSFSVEVEAVAE